jgi:hypothetical protein
VAGGGRSSAGVSAADDVPLDSAGSTS